MKRNLYCSAHVIILGLAFGMRPIHRASTSYTTGGGELGDEQHHPAGAGMVVHVSFYRNCKMPSSTALLVCSVATRAGCGSYCSFSVREEAPSDCCCGWLPETLILWASCYCGSGRCRRVGYGFYRGVVGIRTLLPEPFKF
jgi:hypothetical protein